MAFVFSDSGAGTSGQVTRPIVLGLFVSTCLLSIVSWYTTYRGMALYLSVWFSFLASLGIQAALVLVAWLIGFTRDRRPLLIAVYAATAIVSIGFWHVDTVHVVLVAGTARAGAAAFVRHAERRRRQSREHLRGSDR